MLSFQDSLEQLTLLNFRYNDYGETLSEITEHIYCQLDNKRIYWIEEDGKIIAYYDFFWVNSPDEVYLYEQIGMIPDGTKGGILYINNLVIDSPDKGIIWDLWHMKPKSDFILYKRGDEKLKLRRLHDAKTKQVH